MIYYKYGNVIKNILKGMKMDLRIKRFNGLTIEEWKDLAEEIIGTEVVGFEQLHEGVAMRVYKFKVDDIILLEKPSESKGIVSVAEFVKYSDDEVGNDIRISNFNVFIDYEEFEHAYKRNYSELPKGLRSNYNSKIINSVPNGGPIKFDVVDCIFLNESILTGNATVENKLSSSEEVINGNDKEKILARSCDELREFIKLNIFEEIEDNGDVKDSKEFS